MHCPNHRSTPRRCRYLIVRQGCAELFRFLRDEGHEYVISSAAHPAVAREYLRIIGIHVGMAVDPSKLSAQRAHEFGNPPLGRKSAHEAVGWPRSTSIRASHVPPLTVCLDDNPGAWRLPWSIVIEVTQDCRGLGQATADLRRMIARMCELHNQEMVITREGLNQLAYHRPVSALMTGTGPHQLMSEFIERARTSHVQQAPAASFTFAAGPAASAGGPSVAAGTRAVAPGTRAVVAGTRAAVAGTRAVVAASPEAWMEIISGQMRIMRGQIEQVIRNNDRTLNNRTREAPRGLTNENNHCVYNAIIQALAAVSREVGDALTVRGFEGLGRSLNHATIPTTTHSVLFLF